MKVLVKFAFLVIIFSGLSLNAQVKIGGNTNTIDNRSILELESDSLALRVTRLTTTERNAVSSWERGHVIYNTVDSCFQWYTGVNWECMLRTYNEGGTIHVPQDDSATIANMTGLVDGTMVYNTTKNCLAIFVDGKWICIDGASVRQATGGGAKKTLWQNCGCGDTVTVNGANTTDTTAMKTAMNSHCAIILRNGTSGTTNIYQLPHPSGYKDQYFCLIANTVGSASTTATLRRPSTPTRTLLTMHWTTNLDGTSALNEIDIDDPQRSGVIVAKLLSNGFYWFVATGYY